MKNIFFKFIIILLSLLQGASTACMQPTAQKVVKEVAKAVTTPDPRVLAIFKASCEKFGHHNVKIIQEDLGNNVHAETNGRDIICNETIKKYPDTFIRMVADHENTHIKYKDCQKMGLLKCAKEFFKASYSIVQIRGLSEAVILDAINSAHFVPATVLSAAGYLLFSIGKLSYDYYSEKRADTHACTLSKCSHCMLLYGNSSDDYRGYLSIEACEKIALKFAITQIRKGKDYLCEDHKKELQNQQTNNRDV